MAFKIRHNVFLAWAHDAPPDALVEWERDTPPQTPPTRRLRRLDLRGVVLHKMFSSKTAPVRITYRGQQLYGALAFDVIANKQT